MGFQLQKSFACFALKPPRNVTEVRRLLFFFLVLGSPNTYNKDLLGILFFNLSAVPESLKLLPQRAVVKSIVCFNNRRVFINRLLRLQLSGFRIAVPDTGTSPLDSRAPSPPGPRPPAPGPRPAGSWRSAPPASALRTPSR